MNARWPLPAPRLVSWLAAAVVPAAIAMCWPEWQWLWLLHLTLLAIAITVDGLLGPRAREIRIERDTPARMIIGRPNTRRFVIKLTSGPSVLAWLKEDRAAALDGNLVLGPLTLSAQRDCVVEHVATPRARGRHELGTMHLRYRNRVGLLTHRAVQPDTAVVSVYPAFSAARGNLRTLQQLGAAGGRRTRLRGEGTDFDHLREYRPGDEAARIDWKATARRGRVVSRQFTVEKNHDVIIALDAGRLMGARFAGVAKLDHALDATLALAQTGLTLGDRIGAMAFAERVRAFIAPGKGLGQLALLLDELHDLMPETAEPAFDRALQFLAVKHRKRSLVVMFTDFIDRHTAMPMVEGLAMIARRHACLFVAVEDPVLQATLDRDPTEPRDAYEKVVAYQMRRERNAVLEILKQQGISVLNCLPSELTAPVINRYLELRFKGSA